MSIKHTPGPWRVAHNAKLGWAGILTQEGDVIADISVDARDFRAPEQALDDANLIAGAPDLLKACEALLEAERRAGAGESGGFGLYHDAVELAQAVVEKLKGGNR